MEMKMKHLCSLLCALAVAVFVTAFVGVFEARACSVCMAGDPNFDANGATAQQLGDFNAYLEVRGWKKESGVLAHHDDDHDDGGEGEAHEDEEREENVSQRLDLYLSYTPIDRLTLTMGIPVKFNEITHGDETSSIDGLGDISFAATGVVWRNRDVLPSTWVEARLVVKTPTGKSKKSVNGEAEPHLQAGTGSWDTGLGAAMVHKLEWASLYTSFLYKINTKGSLDYEYGDALLANLAIEVPVGHAIKVPALNWLRFSTQLNYRWADKDQFENENFNDSGGSILYISPGLAMTLPWFENQQAPVLRVSTQVPVTSSWLNGHQHEDPVWAAGLLMRF
jgi:hypothetical protein